MPVAPPERAIRSMFDGLADHYDLLNDVLSLGLDRRWRRAAAGAIDVRPGDRVLDLGCGTGRLGRLVAGRARVVGVDLSLAMLRRARRDERPSFAGVQGSAFHLPFRDGVFAAAVSGFVLRNLHDLSAAFGELSRVVRPEGRVALIDITEPTHPALRRLFDGYLDVVAPALGGLAGKRSEYRYLAGSLAQLPPPADVRRLLSEAGFEHAMARRMTGGVVTLFTATRPPVGTGR